MKIGVTEHLQADTAAREWQRVVDQAKQQNGTNGVILVPRSAILWAAGLLDDCELLAEELLT